MKKIRVLIKPIASLLLIAFLISSCASATLIESFPSGANVYVNGESVGKTPYTMQDTKISGTCSLIRLEKEGYTVTNTSICKNEEADVGAIIGGCFFLFPFLWTTKYKATHSYNLVPTSETESTERPGKSIQTLSKAERLIELNELYEKGILTKKEYQVEKEKILNEK